MNNSTNPSRRSTGSADQGRGNSENEPLAYKLRSAKRQKEVDFTELIVFVIVNCIQIAMTIVMSAMDFKMFSIILFFTAPMWLLTFISVCLLILRLSK